MDWQSELRTVRQGGPDGPPVGLEICPETLLSLVVWRRYIADSPLRVSGQSASQYRKFSRNIGGSGGVCLVEPRTVRNLGADSPRYISLRSIVVI